MPTRTTTFATNDNVTANDLNALAGAWSSYTPTLGGFTAGNGTGTGKYLQFGKLVIFRATFTFGSTTVAASAYPTLTLPVTAAAAGFQDIGGAFGDASGTNYQAIAHLPTTSTVSLGVIGTNGAQTTPTAVLPFTWTTTDAVVAWGTYEAA